MQVVQATADKLDESPVAQVKFTNQQQWFVEIIPPMALNAGKKAFDDVNNVMKAQGFRSVLLDRDRSPMRRALAVPMQLFRLARVLLNRCNAVLVQAPLPLEAKWFVQFLLRFHRATVIMLIHDIDSLRYADKLHEIPNEMKLLGSADVIICHNASMNRWLRERGVRKPIVELTFFDYLVNDQSAKQPSVPSEPERLDWRREIVFAGNLRKEKSGFLYALSNDYGLRIRVFGGATSSMAEFPSCVSYSGHFPPNDPILPKCLFGLVWDGQDIATCSGVSGSYLKINSPHKVSLYLACGMPVICWRGSAIATEIETKQLGISVESLSDIPAALESLTPSVYAAMLDSVAATGRSIRHGRQLIEALDRAMVDSLGPCEYASES